MSTNQLRGKIFEDLIKIILKKHGYVGVPEALTSSYGLHQKNGITRLKGRGAKHQIDALGQFDFQIPFVYPIRLISEAKCLNKKVGLGIVRNFVGVIKDVSENYFIEDLNKLKDEQRFRFTDCGVIFSASEFTEPAQKYAYAQGIYLVLAANFYPIVNSLIIKKDFLKDTLLKKTYFGLASSFYPIMITGNKEIPFKEFLEDRVDVKIYYDYNESRTEIYNFRIRFRGWEGVFQLPKYTWHKHITSPNYKRAMSEMKKKILNHIDIPIKLGNIRRIIRFRLDRPWLDAIKK